MTYEKDLSRRDVNAVDGFVKKMTDAGIADEQLKTVRDYCLISLTAREDQDPIVPTEDVDSPLLIELESKREAVDRNLVREADLFLQEHLCLGGHGFTVNPRMDDCIRPPVTLFEAWYLSPPNVHGAKDWPKGALEEALGAFWPEANVSPRVVANALRYKQ
jgi:hypothetical protein